MPTTSSPWASPSSPAGRRLLLSESATADDIPILDDATLALGAALAAAASAPLPVAPVPTRARTAPARGRPRLGLGATPIAAALAVVLLALGAVAGLGRPAPVASTAGPSATTALAHAAGSALGTEATVAAAPVAASPVTSSPVADGRVVVALVDRTAAVGAAPGTSPGPTLAARLGAFAALAGAGSAG